MRIFRTKISQTKKISTAFVAEPMSSLRTLNVALYRSYCVSDQPIAFKQSHAFSCAFMPWCKAS